MTSRPTFDEYFLLLARLVSVRSTCLATPVGAVIVRDNQVISTGYNGVPSGTKHCTENGFCYRDLSMCTESKTIPSRAIHAEVNAIASAAKRGLQTEGATLYTTLQPCISCLKLIIASGIKEVYYESPLSSNRAIEIELEIKITQIEIPELIALQVANRVVNKL